MKIKIDDIPSLNKEVSTQAQRHIDSLTKPIGSLGRLETLAIELAEMTGNPFPTVTPPATLLFASDHGVTAEGVSAYPKEVTAQMVLNFLVGGAAMNVFSRHIGAQFAIVDVGVSETITHEKLISRKIRRGTRNFVKEAAMTEAEAHEALSIGKDEARNLIDNGAKCMIVGEMGIGNTTSASALLAAITEKNISELIGPGTGLSKEQMKVKEQIIENALKARMPDKNDPIDLVTKLGGFEIVAMAGAMLEAGRQRIPIILDGFICTVSAIIATKMNRRVSDYMIAGHLSAEPGHRVALQYLDKQPLLELNMRLGEGTGAAIAYPIVEAATKMVSEMATFAEAGVSEKK